MNEYFDKEVTELITEHWGEFTDLKCVKRDYNIVYSLTLKNQQNCYVKVKPCHDRSRDELDKVGRQEMFFVDYMAKNTKLTSSFIQPGILSSKHFNINMVTAEKGSIAQLVIVDLYKNEDAIMKLGRQVAQFHNCSRQFRKDHPEQYEGM